MMVRKHRYIISSLNIIPKQVDTDVLNELPKDIRHQIQEALKEKQKKKKSVKSEVKTPFMLHINSDQPGCSYWTAPDVPDFVEEEEWEVKAEKTNNIHNMSDIERELLPNLSQVSNSMCIRNNIYSCI